MRKQRKQHAYTKPFQAVKVFINEEVFYGIIISRFHKLPKKASIEEPYYLVSGIGNAIWEDNLSPISDADYKKATELEGGN